MKGATVAEQIKQTPTREENKRTVTAEEAERLKTEAIERQKRQEQRQHAEERIAELNELLDEIDLIVPTEAEAVEQLSTYTQQGGQ